MRVFPASVQYVIFNRRCLIPSKPLTAVAVIVAWGRRFAILFPLLQSSKLGNLANQGKQLKAIASIFKTIKIHADNPSALITPPNLPPPSEEKILRTAIRERSSESRTSSGTALKSQQQHAARKIKEKGGFVSFANRQG